MEKIYYNKLCRDNIPEIIKGKGFECEARQMDHDEYKRELLRKVYEEASGIVNYDDRAHMIDELVDLIITIEAVRKEFSILEEEIEIARQKNEELKGGYNKRLYLSWSSDTEYHSNEQTHGFDD